MTDKQVTDKQGTGNQMHSEPSQPAAPQPQPAMTPPAPDPLDVGPGPLGAQVMSRGRDLSETVTRVLLERRVEKKG
jgi:hypothetical protein